MIEEIIVVVLLFIIAVILILTIEAEKITYNKEWQNILKLIEAKSYTSVDSEEVYGDIVRNNKAAIIKYMSHISQPLVYEIKGTLCRVTTRGEIAISSGKAYENNCFMYVNCDYLYQREQLVDLVGKEVLIYGIITEIYEGNCKVEAYRLVEM